MATTHKAGTLILTNIGMFNEAAYHFSYEVEPKILEKIDEKISTFANKNDWVGKFQLHSDDDCWVAPKNWNIAEEGDDLDIKAKLEIDCIADDDDDDDYWIALFCGEGRKGGRQDLASQSLIQNLEGKYHGMHVCRDLIAR